MQTPEEFTNALAYCTMPEAIEADFLAKLARLEVKSMGWIQLDDGAYLHLGNDEEMVEIVGLAYAPMAELNVLSASI